MCPLIQDSPGNPKRKSDLVATASDPLYDFSAFSSTFDLIGNAAEAFPSAVAMTFLPSGDQSIPAVHITRQELVGSVRQAANLFRSLGVGAEDVVSFLLPNLLEAQYTLWGGQVAGRENPINFLLNAEQIAEICNAAQTKILVALGPHPTLKVWEKVIDLPRRVESLTAILVVGPYPDTDGPIQSFHTAMAKQPRDRLTFDRKITRDDVASIFHTGGTTGNPKLVPHTHENELIAAESAAQMLAMTEKDTVINGLPLFHVAAPILLTLTPLSVGARVVIPTAAGLRDQAVIQNYWRICQNEGITIAGGVPTSLSDLTQVPVGDADISKVAFAITGGAPLTEGLAKQFKAHCGLEVRQIYGMTETSGLIALVPRDSVPMPGSVGKSAPGIEIKAVKVDRLIVRDAGPPIAIVAKPAFSQ